jgi:predicted nucleotidyltransferase
VKAPVLGLHVPNLGAIVPNMGTNGVGLAKALFTKTQRRVLGLFFGNPGRSYYAKELMRLAGSGTGAVHRELEKLVEAGLVVVEKVGNQKHYQANRNSPIFDELHGIAVKTFGIADILLRILDPIAKKIKLALIFGSVARESDTAASDIDLLIVSHDLTYPDLFTLLAGAEERLSRSVNPLVFNPPEFQNRLNTDNAFIRRVTEQPVIFLIGSEDDLKRT